MDESETQELGKRAQKLNELNARFINSLLDSFSWQEFEECCRPLIDRNEHQLEMAYEQMLDYCKDQLWKKYDQIKKDADMDEKLNKLEDAIRQAKENPSKVPLKIIPQPDQTIRSLRVKLKFEALTKLREEDTKLRAENKRLMNELAPKSENLENIKSDVDIQLKRVQEAVNVAESIPVETLEQVIDQLS